MPIKNGHQDSLKGRVCTVEGRLVVSSSVSRNVDLNTIATLASSRRLNKMFIQEIMN